MLNLNLFMPLSPDLFVFLLQTYICLVIDTSLTILVKLIVANVQHEYVFNSRHDAPLQGICAILHPNGASPLLNRLSYLNELTTTYALT
jgi:hypothetical protein